MKIKTSGPLAFLSFPSSSKGIAVCSSLHHPPSGLARGGRRGKVPGGETPCPAPSGPWWAG